MNRKPLSPKLRMLNFGYVLNVVCLIWSISFAQAQERPARAPAIKSIEVKDDRTVVVRIWAPNAKEVRFSGSDVPGISRGTELKRGENGVWEGTIGPIPAGSYRYNFTVDGIATIDPMNPRTSESNANTWSLFHVPGSPYSDLKDVPHGAVAQLHYHSKSLDRFRRAHVYTPPGYENDNKSYPVLYLLHGAMDCDASWSTVGRAGIILDNLIAEKKVQPMVMVMPMGHTGAFSFGLGSNSLQQQMSEFQNDFVKDLRPHIESRYRLLPGSQNRAIAGLSMGGAQTLEIVIANLTDYAYIGVFSSGVFGIANSQGSDTPKWQDIHRAALSNKENKQHLKQFWFATGKEDFLLSTTKETVRVFKENAFDITYKETDGGHTWINWREHYLPEFAQLLFRQ